MFLVLLSFVMNLWNVFLVWLPNICLAFCYYFGISSYCSYDQTLHVPPSLYLHEQTLVYISFFSAYFLDISVRGY